MVWMCISHDCKLDLVTIQGNLTGDQYIREILQPIVVPHFDNMLLPTDECFAQKVPESVYDGLTCPKYALCDSNPAHGWPRNRSHGFARTSDV
jgi:hypothetical protein